MVLYFAYGSNLCADDLAAWCRARSVKSLELELVGPAFLPDRRLAFTHFSTARGGGVLDVFPVKGHAVEGAVFRLGSDRTLAALDRKEGEGHAYRRIETIALTADGGETPVFTYEVVPEHRQTFVAPTERYVEVVRRGYEAHGLSVAPLMAAARAERHPGTTDGLFVYGTLMRGEERHHVLLRHRIVERGEATTPGTLVDLGAFPGLVLGSARCPVRGELYEPLDPPALFEELDVVEGFQGFGVFGSLFRRTLVAVRSVGLRSRTAWVYVYVCGSGRGDEIASGDWRRVRRS